MLVIWVVSKNFSQKLERLLVGYNKVIIIDGATWIWNWVESKSNAWDKINEIIKAAA